MTNECFEDEKDCNGVIVDDKTCMHECPKDHYKHKEDEKKCTKTCEIIEDISKKICNLKCEKVHQILNDKFEVE